MPKKKEKTKVKKIKKEEEKEKAEKKVSKKTTVKKSVVKEKIKEKKEERKVEKKTKKKKAKKEKVKKEKEKKEEREIYRTVGRRKTSVARVWLSFGSGDIVVNNKPILDYFKTIKEAEIFLNKPFFAVARQKEKFDISIKVKGGGISSQLSAVIHGIARALEKYDGSFRPALKKAGLLKRDPRMKERRKYGLRKARKARQFSKR